VSLAARKIRLIMTLRRGGITDTNVMAAIERIPREDFVPDAFHDQAYEDKALPIGQGQTISQPQIVALMTQALELTSRHKILEVGTGSGYQAAVLSRLVRRVYTVERHAPLLREAEARFAALRISNITSIAGDGMKGWPAQAPFDRIIVTAAAAALPEILLDQLAVEGIMVLPLGPERGDQELIKIRRDEGGLKTEKLCDVRFVPLLPGLPQQRAHQ
jgi:protein-L-isoaspartate(D-aspartate) O-methyltransferase